MEAILNAERLRAGSRPRFDASGLAVTIARAGGPAEIAPRWRRLEAQSGCSFFLSWTWIGVWLRLLDRPAYLIEVKDGPETIGLGLLAPGLVVEHRLLPVRLLGLHATGDPVQDVITIEYNGFLAKRGREAEVTGAALQGLAAQPGLGGGWDALDVSGLGDDQLPLFDASGLRTRLVARAGSSRVDLDAVRRSGKDYLVSLSSNARGQIRRSLRLYAERGEVRLEAARDVAEALAFLAEATPLHQARGRPGAFASARFTAFHDALIRQALPEGTAEVLKIQAGGEAIGYLYNFIHGGIVYFYLSGLRYEADNRLKPGLVTHTLAIQHYLERGLAAYDFMAGGTRYKATLGQPGPDILQLRLERPCLKLRLVDLARLVKRRLQGASPDPLA